jgi:3-phosphoshikimate 1-carboxyvinyltransferase
VNGAIDLPGSKSISNRALILAALAEGETTLTGVLFSRDTEIMLRALKSLGFVVEADAPVGLVKVTGGAGTIPSKTAQLHVGNAGTAARFLTAFLALCPEGEFYLEGDEAMHARPMEGLLEGLAKLGARFTFHGTPGHFPFTLHTRGLAGGELTVEAGASSQFVSALLMAAPYAQAPLTVHAPGVRPAFVEITTAMMRYFGVTVESTAPDTFSIPSGAFRSPEGHYAVEPDVTAASYFLALPLVTGGQIYLPGLTSEMIQGDTAFAGIVEQLGGQLTKTHVGWTLTAPPEDQSLPGVSADFATFSDTFLTLAAIAPFCSGPVRIEGIAHTRHQETDRIAAMATELRKLGLEIIEEPGALEIHPDREKLGAAARAGVTIETYEDHRVAMSFALLGSADLRGDGSPWLQLKDPLCCRKTFPDFFEKLAALHAASHL